MSDANTIHRKAVDLIGKETIDKLAIHGLTVVDHSAVERFVREHEASNTRLREAAAACMRVAGLVTIRAEIQEIDSNPVVILTHPAGDEAAMAQSIGEILASLYHPPQGGRAPTAEERANNPRDTNDVDIHAKAGDDEAREAEAASYAADERARMAPGTPEALTALNWPGHLGGPGERVLLLAAQGFDGVGRRDAAKRANEMAASCSDDADAMRLLRGFRWNELADLPFPIREVLGFDKDGNPVDGEFQ